MSTLRKRHEGDLQRPIVSILGLLFLSISLMLPKIVQAEADRGPECGDSTERTIPENSLVTSVETDGYFGTIYYTTYVGDEGVLTMGAVEESRSIGTHRFPRVGPLLVFVQGNPTHLAALEGEWIKELKALRRDCFFWHPAGGWLHLTTQWIVLAKLALPPEGGTGSTTDPLTTIEGFIVEINDAAVTISKEGKVATVIVTEDTRLTVNGTPVTLASLRLGDKAKAKYAPSTLEAVEIKAER